MTSSRSEEFDLGIVGAGPAGLSAAVTAADAGCRVVLLDSAERIGGQYHRHAPAALAGDTRVGKVFGQLRAGFEAHVQAGRVDHRPGHAVWSLVREQQFVVNALQGERERAARSVRVRSVLVATGAHDRQVPFPGWTLPGVVAVGGAQALYKGARVAVGRRVVVAGTGPFLLPVAVGLLAAGVEVVAVVEANDPRAYARAPRALVGALHKLPEAAGYALALARHRVPYLTRHAVVSAHGSRRLEGVTVSRVQGDWTPVAGTQRSLPCDALAVGYGFTAQLELLLGLGCEAAPGGGGLAVAVDGEQRTTVEGVYAAGETTGIGGADLAAVEGALAGAAAARALGMTALPGPAAIRRLEARRRRLRRFAQVLHAVHPVRDGWTTWVDDSTLVCRCEEVTVGALRQAVDEHGAVEARTVKLLARPGMGWCQGRICGTATATLTSCLSGRPTTTQDAVGAATRTLAQPVPLGVLASLYDEPARDGDVAHDREETP
jgi:thioredoxin reductase